MQITKGKSLIALPLRLLVYLCLSLAIIFLSGFLETTTTVIPGDEFLFAEQHDKPVDYLLLEQEIPGLKKQYMIGGGILLVIGLLILAKLYRSVEGIKLMTNTVTGILDTIVILILAALGFMGMDYILAGQYGTTSLMGEEGLLGAVCYVLILLILPVVVSWQSARAILITEQGILDSCLFFKAFMTWDELSRMELMDDVEFSSRRRSFKVLFMHTLDENAVTISGNIRSKAKKEIKKLLLQHVPADRRQEMETLLRSL